MLRKKYSSVNLTKGRANRADTTGHRRGGSTKGWKKPRFLKKKFLVFTALHVMQTRYSEENSVCLSVRHTRDPWQNGREICPDFYTIRKNIYPSFLRRRMVGGGATPSTRNFGSTDPRWNEIADFQSIIARSSSALTPSEKSSINANRKVHYALSNEPKMIVVRCP